MIGLTAGDALSDQVVVAAASARPGELARRGSRGVVYAVCAQAGGSASVQPGAETAEPSAPAAALGKFLGLVPAGAVARNPQRSFEELLPEPAGVAVAVGTPLPEVLKQMRVQGADALAVLDETQQYVGIVTQASITQALLKRERELLKKSREFRVSVQDDKKRRYESVRRLEQVNQAFRKLMALLARPAGLEIFQRGIEALTIVTQAGYGGVLLLERADPARDSFSAGKIPGPETDTDAFHQQKNILLQEVAHQNKIVMAGDVPGYLRRAGFEVARPTLRSFLGVPIGREGQVFGAVFLCEGTAANGFSDDEEVLATSFAQALGLVIAQGREQAQRRRAERERDLVARLALELAAVTTLRQLAEALMRLTGETWGWEEFAVAVGRRGGRGPLRTLLRARRPAPPAALNPNGTPLPEGIADASGLQLKWGEGAELVGGPSVEASMALLLRGQPTASALLAEARAAGKVEGPVRAEAPKRGTARRPGPSAEAAAPSAEPSSAATAAPLASSFAGPPPPGFKAQLWSAQDAAAAHLPDWAQWGSPAAIPSPTNGDFSPETATGGAAAAAATELAPMASAILSPVKVRDELVGGVALLHRAAGHFDTRDRDLLRRLTDGIAPALARCQAEAINHAFFSLGLRLSTAREPEEAAGIIVDTADELLGWDACSVYLYNEAEQISHNLLHVDLVGGRRELVGSDTLTRSPGPLARRTIEHGPLLILREEVEFDGTDADPFGDKSRPSASLLFVPLRVGASVTGILTIQSYTPNSYDERDLDLLQALADHCAGALERTRVERQLRRISETPFPI